MKSTVARVSTGSTYVLMLMLCGVFFLHLEQACAALPQTTQEIDQHLAKLQPEMQSIALLMLLKSFKEQNITKSNNIYAHALRKLEEIVRTSPNAKAASLAATTLQAYDPGNPVANAKIDALAKNGDAEAQYFLGLVYRDGSGRPKDPAKSHAWMMEAGKRGHARGAFEAGQNYFFGQSGQIKNEQKGFEWFLKSAEAGYPPAQVNVSLIYYTGKLVKRDMNKFLYWMQKAADAGDPQAKQFMDDVKKAGLVPGAPQ